MDQSLNPALKARLLTCTAMLVISSPKKTTLDGHQKMAMWI
jgi:hypothetical protein